MCASKASADSLRIIRAVAAKDILDGIRNKTMLGIVLGVAILLASSMALPLITTLDDTPRLAVYDPGHSEFVESIRRERKVRLAKVPSLEALERYVGESSGPLIGLAVPDNVDDLLQAEGFPKLTGFYLHWADGEDVSKARVALEVYLTTLSGREVGIDLEGNAIYPEADAGGVPYMMGLRTMIAVLTICLSMVPHLIIEEKESHTMEALQVSPASMLEITTGKGLTGLVYGIVAGLVGYAVSFPMIVSWPAAIAAIAAGGLFAASLGLLMGGWIENPQQLGLWLGLPIAFFLVPSFLIQLGTVGWPDAMVSALEWFPSVAMARLIQMSLARTVEAGRFLAYLAALLLPSAGCLALVVWRLRRQDR